MNASILSGQNSGQAMANWRELGHRFFPHNVYLHQRFGSRVQKISLDGGFTCPNVDGTVATGGCTFCDNQSFSPSRRVRRDVIINQIESGIVGLRRRYSSEKFLAYFQPATNTYGSLEKLRTLYAAALEDPRIVGLVIGTRPDCVADDVLDLIDEFAQRTYVSLELGVQTIHDASLVWMNRGHLHAASVDAMRRVAGRKFSVGMHVMLGLPGETHAMMMETAEQVAKWNPAGIKIHNCTRFTERDWPIKLQVARCVCLNSRSTLNCWRILLNVYRLRWSLNGSPATHLPRTSSLPSGASTRGLSNSV